MLAPGPAAGPAFAVEEITLYALDLAGPRLLFLGHFDPANPLVAGERREIDPCRQGLCVGQQKSRQIFRDFMDNATRNDFCQLAHMLRNGPSAERQFIKGSTIGKDFASRIPIIR
jgi:hypothetical protein